MTFHLAGFTESQDSATLVNVAAIADPMLTVSGDDITIPSGLNRLRFAYALGANTTRAQLASPTLRSLINENLELTPIDQAAEPTGTSAEGLLLRLNMPLGVNEKLNALAAENATSAARSDVYVWLEDGIRIPLPPGPIMSFRFTRANVVTANVWDNGALTLSVPAQIPAGTYAVVGMRATATGMKAARFVFPRIGGVVQQNRPGTIGYDTVTETESPLWRRGGLGEVWGYMTETSLPTVDVVSVSTDSDVVVHVDVIKVR